MPKIFSIKPAITLRGRKFKGLRGYAGKPFHPPLTDIPIAAYVLAGVFDLLSFLLGDDTQIAGELHVAGTWALRAGFIVSIPTILTGLWDWWKSTPKHTQSWRTANWHMALMLTTTLLVVVMLIMRDYSAGVVTGGAEMVLSLVIAGLVSWGATYGGSLVFDYGFNVETSGDHPAYHESESDVYPGQH